MVFLASSAGAFNTLFRQGSTHSNRQHLSGCLYKQGRRHEVGPTVCPSELDPELVLKETGNSQTRHIPGQLNFVN